MKAIFTPNAPQAIGPYSQAILVNDWLFISGQIPLNPKTMVVESDDVIDQTHQVLKNLNAVLTEAGFSFNDVVKTTIFIQNMNDFNQINAVYGEYFNEHKPARATVEVSRLPKDVKIEIELIANKSK
jgi:2-iminobutanoate/2-iminopropanoate deaminase